MERWTKKMLDELEDKQFAICILQERLNGIRNPYSPLATKLLSAIQTLREGESGSEEMGEQKPSEKDMSEFHINGDGFGCYAYIKTDIPERVHVYKVVGFFESNGYCSVPIRYNSEPYLHKEIVPVANVIHCGIDESKVIRVAIADCEKITERIGEGSSVTISQLLRKLK